MHAPSPFSEIQPLGAPVADTHAHLDMLDDPASALANAALAGVSFVVTVVDPTEDAERTFQELEGWRTKAAQLIGQRLNPTGEGDSTRERSDVVLPEPPDVRVIIGAHPHNAKDFDSSARERLRAFATDPLVAGVGEIGLDYHYDHSPREVQRAAFAGQLEMASRLGLPAIVHLREAHDDGEVIMRETGLPPAGCVLHCFTGDVVLLDRFVEMGCYVSFAGPVTFKKADAIREAASHVPLERLLLETDCPFMTPEPYRGRPNEPALTVFIARRIAEARGLPAHELAAATSVNARKLLGGRGGGGAA